MDLCEESSNDSADIRYGSNGCHLGCLRGARICRSLLLWTEYYTRLWRLRAARAARGAPAGGSAGVAGAHKFTEGAYFLFPFRRVSRLRRPFFLRPIASPCWTGSQSRTRGHITKSNYGVAPKHRDLTETLEWRRPSRRLRLARWSEPASVPFSRNALYYLSQEKRGSTTCLKSKLEELEGHEASSSKGRMRAQRRAPGNLLGLRGAILRSITNIKNEQI